MSRTPKHDTQALRRMAAAPDLDSLKVGDRVMTPEGFPGKVTDFEEGSNDTTYMVLLDGGMGGGEYSDNELTPMSQQTASQQQESSIVTAADWYPELGTILHDRPDHPLEVPADEYYGGRVASKTAAVGDYLDGYTQGEQDSQTGQPKGLPFGDGQAARDFARGYHDGFDGKVSYPTTVHADLFFPLDPHNADPSNLNPMTPGEDAGWQDGYHDGMSGGARAPKQDDAEYRSGYLLGWAEGVKSAAFGDAGPPLPGIESALDEILISESGLFDFIKGSPTPSKNWAGPGQNYSYDWCFLPEAPVLMADGTEKPISQVVVGDEVITHLGRSRRVLTVASKPYSGDLCRVRVHGENTRDIVSTDQHAFWSGMPGALAWNEIGSLEPGAFLTRSIITEEIPVLVSYTKTVSTWARYGKGVSHRPTKRLPWNFVYRTDGRSISKSFLTLSEARAASNEQHAPEIMDIKVDEDVAWLLGLYAGDGWRPNHKGNLGGYAVSFSIGDHQHEIISRLSRIALEYFGVASRVYPEAGKQAVRVDINHWALFALVGDLVGDGSHNKVLDGRLLTMPISEQRALLAGYSDSDGCLSDDGRRVIDSVSVMPRQMQEILARLGTVSNLRWKREGVQRVEWWGGKNSLSRQFISDGQVHQQIKSSVREHYEGVVWDIEVEEDHSFRAYGMNVHNCRFRKNSHCFFSKNLDEQGSKEAGYAVWIPEDRGNCPRVKWEDQKVCPIGEPGEHSNEPERFVDATVPWEQGGQHGGVPGPAYQASLAADSSDDKELGFHLTASWSDVRAKAKRIRAEGGVRVVSVKAGLISAEVRGDTNVYETELNFVPGKYAVSHWTCACAWGSYSWGRTGPFRKYEGRMCSHGLAVNYEAQARGMFGKTLYEDHKAPVWMDTTIPVKRPGGWDKDKGRYSSLRPVTAQVDDDVPSIDILDPKFAMDDGSFFAKVRGIVQKLFIKHDAIVDTHGTPAPVSEILYPTYDPRLGLNFRPTASLSTEAAGTDFGAAARAFLHIASQKEPAVTSRMTGLAAMNGGEMHGLANRLKTPESLERKMADEAHMYNGDAGMTAAHMSDSLRYTMVFPDSRYSDSTKKTLDDLGEDGYKERVKNYWERGDAYNGINAAMTTPDGHPFELQFHTPESSEVKKPVHDLYEVFRTTSNPTQRLALWDKMVTMFDKVPQPSGVLSIPTLKRQPAPSKAASASTTTYYAIGEDQDNPHGVMRVIVNNDDARVEVWKDGAWVMDNSFARYPMFGEPRSEEISEEEANAFTRQNDGKEASVNDNDTWLFAVPARTSAHKDSEDAFGMTIDNDPKEALPVTYGDEEEELAKHAILAALSQVPDRTTANSVSSFEGPQGGVGASPDNAADLLAQHEARMSGIGSVTGKDPFAHLKGGSGSNSDVADRAKAYLSTTALKDFTPIERAQIIGEGEGVTAGNLSDLDLTGTHYQAQEEARNRQDTDDDTLNW